MTKAQKFVADNGLTFPIYWEGPDTFETWFHYGVVSQPAVVLLDSTGAPVEQWLGGIPEDKVLEIVEGL